METKARSCYITRQKPQLANRVWTQKNCSRSLCASVLCSAPACFVPFLVSPQIIPSAQASSPACPPGDPHLLVQTPLGTQWPEPPAQLVWAGTGPGEPTLPWPGPWRLGWCSSTLGCCYGIPRAASRAVGSVSFHLWLVCSITEEEEKHQFPASPLLKTYPGPVSFLTKQTLPAERKRHDIFVVERGSFH